MPRPPRRRRLRGGIGPIHLKPAGIPSRDLEEVRLGLDEAEALRLADFEGLYQEAAARSMGVSRQTFGRIIESARRKVADAILNEKALRLEGEGPDQAPVHTESGASGMKIALPSQDGMLDAHFGRCAEYAVFSVVDGALVEEPSIPNPAGFGCKSGLAGDLARLGVTHLVAGNMGEGALHVLSSHGITVVRGASGSVREAAEAFLSGKLGDSGSGCAGHGEDRECSH